MVGEEGKGKGGRGGGTYVQKTALKVPFCSTVFLR